MSNISNEELRKAQEFVTRVGGEFGQLIYRALTELQRRRAERPNEDNVWQPIPRDGKIPADGICVVRRSKGVRNRSGEMKYSLELAYYTVSETWVAGAHGESITRFDDYMEIPK